MTVTSATEARKNLFNLVRQVNEDADTVTITSKAGNAVLVGEAEWESLKETLFAMSMPNYERIREDYARIRSGDTSGLVDAELIDPDTVVG